jgi:hypothetical protein
MMLKRKPTISSRGPAAMMFILALLSAGCGSKNNAVVQTSEVTPVESSGAALVTLFDPALSFAPPAEFKSIDAKDLRVKLAENEHPRNIFADEDQEGLILVTYDDRAMTPDDLAKEKESTENARRNDAPWIDSTIIEMSGRKWWRFETEEVDQAQREALTAPGQPKTPVDPRKFRVHYLSYSTIFRNKLLKFTFRSPGEEYPHLKPGFIQSFRSIQIKE